MRRESAGKLTVEGETVRIVLDSLERGCVGNVGYDRNGGAAAGADNAGFRPNPVTHEERGNAPLSRETCNLAVHIVDDDVTLLGIVGIGKVRKPAVDVVYVEAGDRMKCVPLENPAAGVRIAVEKSAGYRLGGIIGVPVEHGVTVNRVAEMTPPLYIVLYAGAPRYLGRIFYIFVAGGDKQSGVVALHASAGGPCVAVFGAEIDEPGFPQRQAGMGRNHVCFAVTFPVPAGMHLDAAPGTIFPEREVHYAGDRIGAVLSRRAVAQYFNLMQGNSRNRRNVGTLSSVGDAVSYPGNDGSAMAAFAVDQHQGMVGGQTAQTDRAYDPRSVTHGLRIHIE